MESTVLELRRTSIKSRLYDSLLSYGYVDSREDQFAEVDSLEAVEAMMDIEEKFGIYISDEDYEKMFSTSGDIFNSRKNSSIEIGHVVDYLVSRVDVLQD